MEAHGKDEIQIIEDPVTENHPPLGKPISTKLTPLLSGDVLESWNFLWRFREVLGLKKVFSFEELITELNGSLFDGLSEAHILMLQVLISELPRKLEHGRKRIVKYSTGSIRTVINVPPLNDLTWPELARRYILAMLFMTGDSDSVEVCEGMDVFRCLYGDGGPRCGALTGVVGLEADALAYTCSFRLSVQLLAASVNKIYGSLYDDSDKLAMDDLDSDKDTTCQSTMLNEGIPGWVQELEPVKKLKTNVGSKIRNCIYSSLAKEPPEWAREILERSVSKEVYRANASGPTKKLALNVVAQFCSMQQNLAITKNIKNFISISDIVMKQCRIVLHRAAAAKKTERFCNLLRKNLVVCGNNKEGSAAAAKKTKRFCNLLRKNLVVCGNNKEGILGSQAMVLSLLYFRMIDMKLATGAYCGSHEAFMEDVREFWRNVQIDFGNYPKLVKFAMEACHVFESLYVKEVVALHQKLVKYSKLESLNADSKKDIENILVFANEIPKAPWDEGVCRVCGIDQDNEKVLLCDECDAEYHTYCLSPPLVRVPGGNWFCPCCVGDKDIVQDAPHTATSLVCQRQKKKREFIDFMLNKTADLEAMMREKEYWDLSLHERSFLLKFFCNEMLDSALIREHLTKYESSLNQHQKSTSVDLQALKDKEDSSLRSEFLGIDSGGKLYWIIDSGTNLWIIVNEVSELHQSSLTSEDLAKNFTLSGIEYLWSARGSEVYTSWACYQSDAEIIFFMDSLKDDDPLRRRLEESILLSHKRRLKVPKESERQAQKELQPSLLKQGQDHLMTKATKVLEFKYGPFVKLETTDFGKNQNKGKVVEGKLYRCECLEPILPAGHHCLSCHKTCFTTMEFKLHGNGKCNIKSRETSITLNGERTTKAVASKEKWKITCSEDGCVPPNSSIGSAIEVDETQRFDKPEGLEQVDKIFPAQDVATKLEIGKFFNVPVSSVWPVMGKASDILTQLKINLLDMEAVVPEGALRPSRACNDRRWAWRLFVKCASTIYEMVQALIVFEDMIKLEYLDCSWRYWSSLSAAANISTLAALSLRIYSLDAAISYEKLSRASNSLELLGKADSGKGRYNRGPKGKPRRTQKKETEETS